MRAYDDFANEVSERQAAARCWASRRRVLRSGMEPRPKGARVVLAAGLRRLALWIEGPGQVTFRPS